MTLINQNSAYNSLTDALISNNELIDGRTTQDRLAFLVDFAKYINFYDGNNKVSGNWEPFLNKDPIFLLASIIKTEYTEKYAQYIHMIKNVDKMKMPFSDENEELVKAYINELIYMLIEMFKTIENWTYYMNNSEMNYNLKSFVIKEVKSKYSKYLWAIIDLKNKLESDNVIKPVEFKIYKEFDLYDEFIWKHSKNKGTYWETLGLNEYLNDNSILQIFDASSKVTGLILSFIKNIIDFAKTEFSEIKAKKGPYPDTVLLRTFIDLIDLYKNQLNLISKRHLKFYFDKILKQSKKQERADAVFACVDLSKKSSSYLLKKSTPFNAGLDALKKPIVFESIDQTNLTSTSIAKTYTLSRVVGSKNYTKLLLKELPDIGKLTKDNNGLISKWDTFGTGTIDNSTEKPSTMGFSFGSPLLYLKEGQRTVTLNMGFKPIDKSSNKTPISNDTFNHVSYYLSTEKSWIELNKDDNKLYHIYNNNCLTISFTLKPSVPSIEKFKNNPDNISCSWPMFKMVFNQFLDVSNPPLLKTLDIQVDVSNLKTLDLYNSSGTINTTKPFQLFGATPAFNSEFIMGSGEVFSKPYTYLLFHFIWDNLPESKTGNYNFETYYSQYNKYLAGNYDKVEVSKSKSVLPSVLPWIVSFLFGWLKKQISVKPVDIKVPAVFNNTAFTVGFEKLINGYWEDKNDKFAKQTCEISSDITKPPVCTPYIKDTDCHSVIDNYETSNLLFSTGKSNTECSLTNESFFQYGEFKKPPKFCNKTPIIDLPEDPNIQNTVLKYSSKSKCGFLRMNLSGLKYGFGSSLYAKIVSAVTLYNAAHISRPKQTTIPIEHAPNPPFSPKVKSLSVTYSASQHYDICSDVGGYPLQCFTYSPFQNYKVYDTSYEISAFTKDIDNSLNSKKTVTEEIALFPELDYNGVLFLGLENVVTSNLNSFYFNLNQNFKSKSIPDSDSVHYSYLSNSGWLPFSPLSDGTNSFTCEGIIKFSIESDISPIPLVMAKPLSWISIGVRGDLTSYSQTSFLKNNGVKLQRSVINDTFKNEAPKLLPNKITKPKDAIPEIASIKQPFSSFGGKSKETRKLLNKRVSTRLKTKGRIVSESDFFRVIKETFNDIYFSQITYNVSNSTTVINVLEEYENHTLPNAFTPLVSTCKLLEIEEYLKTKISPLNTIVVSNFKFEYVIVKATIIVDSVFDSPKIISEIKDQLDIYLSPWINSNNSQRHISQNITTAQIVKFIKSFDGVLGVESANLSSYTNDIDTLLNTNEQIIKPKIGYLLLTSGINSITVSNRDSITHKPKNI
ncbi:MAG: hypothetical protein EVB11_03155 [Winogradskyella sp.]|nr:MAG: hypothetical protein EVB11_03155 [Winogradskyella sp.]